MKGTGKHRNAKQPAKNQDEPVKIPPLTDGTPGIGTPAVNSEIHRYEGRASQFLESAMNGAERVLGCVRGLLSTPFREKCKAAVEANWPDLRKSSARRQFEEMKPLKNEPSGTKLHREQVFMFFDMVETAEHAK